MELRENLPDEDRRLRQTTRDWVAISTLPASWVGLAPDAIIRNLADVVHQALSLDLIYVRLAGLAEEQVLDAVRTAQGTGAATLEVVRTALGPVLAPNQAKTSTTLPDPLGDRTLQVVILPLGGDRGVLVAGSCDPEFPTEEDRVLLDVAANQAEVVVQQRQSERRLREQQEWFRVTLASIGDAVIATDIHGRVTFLNAAAEKLTGWSAEGALGAFIEEVFTIHGEQTGQPMETPVARVLRDGTAAELSNRAVLLSKDGSKRPIDDSAAPIRDEAGKMIGVVLIFRDVTEQRQAEDDLRRSEARKGAILETSLDCIVAIDHEQKVVEFNPAAERTFGYRRDEVVGRSLADLVISPKLRERHTEGLAHFLSTGDSSVFGKRLELEGRRADGADFPVELVITGIPIQGPPLYTVYLRDISERKRSEQHRNARLAVNQVLAQAASTQEAARGVLEAVCVNLGWEAGFFWGVDEQKQVLVCRESWHSPEVPACKLNAASYNRTWEKSKGLPGRVWAANEPVWLPDVPNEASFSRRISAEQDGLRSAFACPVRVGGRMRGVVEFFTTRHRERDTEILEMVATMAAGLGQLIERKQVEDNLREQTIVLEALNQIGAALAAELDPDRVVQMVTDEGTRLTSAEFGAFFYNVSDDRGDSYTLYTLSGRSREAFADFPMPRSTEIFGPTFRGEGVVRLDDVTQDPRFGQNSPYYGMPDGHLPVKSYLAVPVVSRDGEVLGGLFFGHSQAGVFSELHELILVGVAAQAAIAIDNARLYQRSQESEERFRQLAENIEDVFWMTDVRGRQTLFVSRAYETLWGRSCESLYEDPDSYLEAVHPDDRQRIASIEPMAHREATAKEYRIIHSDGSERWVLDRTFPVRDASGEVYRVAGIAEDITHRKQVEHDLKLQARVLESMTEGVSLADENGIIVYTSPAEDRIFGYEPGELIGQHVSVQNAYPPDENRRIVEAIIEQLTKDGAWSGEVHNRRKDGSHFTTYARITALEAGGKRYFVCVQEDITEKKRVDMELQDARARLVAALEAGEIATWTWDIRNNRLFVDAKLARLFNLPYSEAEGGILDQYIRSVHPDDRPKVIEALNESIESGKDYEADYRITQPDGSVRWVVARGRVERDESQRAVRMPGVLVDITERKHLEEELRVRAEQLTEANERMEELLALLDTLQQNAPVGFAFIDREFRYVRINEALAAIDGNLPEQLLGRTVEESVPKLWPKLAPLYRQVLETERPVLNHEVLGETPAAPGQPRYWLVNYFPVRVRDEVVGIGILVTDITERKRLENELRQQAAQLADADRRKDEFLATLAHELRNPLAPIRTGLEIMKLTQNDPASIEEIRDTMERQTQQLIALVDDLLDVSRITRGKLELRKCQVVLAEVLQSAIEASEPLVNDAGHQLTIQIPEHPIYLDADPHRLAQVLSNLLNNAAKYTPTGGEISLSVEMQRGDAVIAVRDTGIGIPAEMLDRIFEMFTQVDRPMEKVYTGLGIGLTLVKSLVEMHGGKIEVHSDGLNQGTTFFVRLPVLTVTTSNGQKIERHNSEQMLPNTRRKVLVVDDNKAAADTLSMVVKMLGNEVRTAGDGEQAIEIAKEFLPDLILMDLGMPKLDGYQTARFIRQQPWGKKMMLVALTGWGQDEDRQRTRDAGFDQHLVKPAEPSELQVLFEEMDRALA